MAEVMGPSTGKVVKMDARSVFRLQEFFQPMPDFDRFHGFCVDTAFHLFQSDKMFSQDALPVTVFLLPAESLTRIKRGGQIVIANRQKRFASKSDVRQGTSIVPEAAERASTRPASCVGEGTVIYFKW